MRKSSESMVKLASMSKNIREIFAKKLRKARELKGLSQRELGLLTGLSDKSISAYEQGRVMPPLDILPKLAKQLDQPLSYFLNEDTPVDNLIIQLEKLETTLREVKKLLPSIKKMIRRRKRPSKKQ